MTLALSEENAITFAHGIVRFSIVSVIALKEVSALAIFNTVYPGSGHNFIELVIPEPNHDSKIKMVTATIIQKVNDCFRYPLTTWLFKC